MKKILLFLALGLTCARADTLLVSDFSNFAPGAYSQSFDGPWSELTAQSGATTFAIGDFGNGAPSGNIGNGFMQWLGDTPQDWSTYAYVTLDGFAAAGNQTATVNLYLEDINGANATLTQFALGDFASGLTSVTLSLLGGG